MICELRRRRERTLFFENGSHFGLSQNDVKWHVKDRTEITRWCTEVWNVTSSKSKREVHFTAIRSAQELYILGRQSAEILLMFAGETESSRHFVTIS